MGLDVSMAFASKTESKVDALLKYFNSIEGNWRDTGVLIPCIGEKVKVDDYFCFAIDLRNTYCSELIEYMSEVGTLGLLKDMDIYHQSTEDTDYSYVNISEPESLSYTYFSDFWDKKAKDVNGISGALIDKIMVATRMY